jgi:hypothetical protein
MGQMDEVKSVVYWTSHIVPQFRNNMSWKVVEIRIRNDETNISRPIYIYLCWAWLNCVEYLFSRELKTFRNAHSKT